MPRPRKVARYSKEEDAVAGEDPLASASLAEPTAPPSLEEAPEPSQAAPTAEHASRTSLPLCGAPLCSITLPDLSHPRCIKWSSEGQACIVTDTCLYILTPALGYDHLLKPTRSSQIVPSSFLHYSATDKGPSSAAPRPAHASSSSIEFFECAIDIGTATSVAVEQPVNRELRDEDYNVPHPGQTFKRFKSADWSPDGDKLAFIDSDLSVRILEAPANPIGGPWTVNRGVRLGDAAGKDALAVQSTALAWSSQDHLAMGTRTGQVHVAYNHKVVKLADIGSGPVTTLSWSSSLTSSDKTANGGSAANVLGAQDTETNAMLLAVQSNSITILHVITRDTDIRLRSSLRSGDEVPRGLQISIAKFLEWDDDVEQPKAVICTSPGAVHTWDFSSAEPDVPKKHWRTCHLLPSEETGIEGARDPHAEAVASDRLDIETYLLTLTSGLQYKIALPLNSSVRPHCVVSTIAEPEVPLDSLRQSVEAHQKVDAWAQDGPNGLIAVMQSAGDISSFRSHADRNAQITFLLPSTSTTDAYEVARELINSSLERSIVWAKRPVHLFRPVIALYQALAPSAKSTMLTEAFEEVEFHHYGAETNLEEDTGNGPSDREELAELLRDGSREMFYILEWLIRESKKMDSHSKSVLALYKKTKVLEEAKILSHWLPRQQNLIKQAQLLNSEAVRLHSKRVEITAGRAHSAFSVDYEKADSAQQQYLRSNFDIEVKLRTQFSSEVEEGTAFWERSYPDWRSRQSLDEQERCPICDDAAVEVEWAPASLWPQRAVCGRGHVSARCSQTYAITSSAEVRTCSSCGLKAQDLSIKASPSEEDVLIEGLDGCTFCGGQWIVIS